MKNFIQVIILVCFILLNFKVYCQKIPPRVNNFRFFTPKGKLITSKQKRYKIEIISPFHNKHLVDSSLQKEGIFQSAAEYDDLITIRVKHGKKKMEIVTAVELDSIVFQKGKYHIPLPYRPLFEYIDAHHRKIRILNQNLSSFQVDKIPKNRYYDHDEFLNKNKDTLNRIRCRFWRNYTLRIPLKRKPEYIYGFYQDTLSSNIYMWNDDFGYVSRDRGRNWQRIPYPDDLEEKVMSMSKKRFESPVLTGDFTKYLRVKRELPPLLSIKNGWYVKLKVIDDLWYLSGQGFMLISNDNGRTWRYYVNENYNVELLEIIDNQYLFNGHDLYYFD